LSVRYEAIRLLLGLTVALGIAVVVAALWALIHGDSLRHSVSFGLYAVAVLALLVGIGGGSPSRRDASSASWAMRWASRDTFAVNKANPPDQTLGAVVVFALIAIVLGVLGWATS
jgi:cytochrome b